MPGELDVWIESEDSSSKYEGKIYLKCTSWNYIYNHIIKFYDLGLLKALADALNFDMSLPPLVTDFGKHTETFDIKFIINDGDPDWNEKKFWELCAFARFKAAHADQVFLYIGDNIKDDGTRLLGVTDKGIEGKISSINGAMKTKEGYITGDLKFLSAIDLLNW